LRQGGICVVNPYLSCGRCNACLAGKPNCCVRISVLGVHQDGGMTPGCPMRNVRSLVPPPGLATATAALAAGIFIAGSVKDAEENNPVGARPGEAHSRAVDVLANVADDPAAVLWIGFEIIVGAAPLGQQRSLSTRSSSILFLSVSSIALGAPI
jgi:hypothetical protein